MAKSQNPNMFGSYPVVDITGKIISVEIAAYGFVAEFFVRVRRFRLDSLRLSEETTSNFQERRMKTWMMVSRTM